MKILKYIESLDRSQMETEMANKKNDTLLKEVQFSKRFAKKYEIATVR